MSDNGYLIIEDDSKGVPAIYAAASALPLRPKKPGQVAPQPVASGAIVRRGALSGNPNADPASGRFAGQGAGKQKLTIVSGQEHLASLTQASIAFIRAAIDANGANQMVIQRSGTDATIQLSRDGSLVSSFTVATNDSSDATKKEQEQASLGPGQVIGSRVPQGVDEAVYTRRLDTVRDFARQHVDIGPNDAKQFLQSRVNDPSQIDLDSFLSDARDQQLDDLVDILDFQMHGLADKLKASNKLVRITAPKAWSKRVFAGLDDAEVLKVVTRLEGKGWDAQDISKNIIGKVSDEGRRTKLEQQFGEQTQKSGKKPPKENQ